MQVPKWVLNENIFLIVLFFHNILFLFYYLFFVEDDFFFNLLCLFFLMVTFFFIELVTLHEHIGYQNTTYLQSSGKISEKETLGIISVM